MIDQFTSSLTHIAIKTTKTQLLLYGIAIRLAALVYGVSHDAYVTHIKYTDIDYHVFNNGSRNILAGHSPYIDEEYRYTPIVALVFLANSFLGYEFGKLLLVCADIYCAQVLYDLNINQGTNRLYSRLYLILWIFNPVAIAISTRGSFEPMLMAIILTSIQQLVRGRHVNSGFLFGLAIHLKLYPIIYALSLYIYLVQRKPYLKTQNKLFYWLKTLSPNYSQIKLFISAGLSFFIISYLSYKTYGDDYLEQSFLYHFRRKDLQHNFSVYFYIFRLLPNHQDCVGKVAFFIQAVGVISTTLSLANCDTNKRTKLRKLTFSLFGSTFVFVSLNKVCTSQYFLWYLIFLPLIADSIRLYPAQACIMIATWLMSQANWLIFAYLYEYQKYEIIDHVGNSSLLFLACNIWLVTTLYSKFDPNLKRQAVS